MATYVAEADTYAGFGSVGKYFGYAGLVTGAAGVIGWAALYGRLPSLHPASSGNQLLLAGMTWVSFGFAAIMAAATLGSLMLSMESRGTVTVNDLGVERQIGNRSSVLLWAEIEGFVVTPFRGGVTLVPREGKRTIVIPRSLDDYRGCIAEIKAHGFRNLPPDNAQVSRTSNRLTWKRWIVLYGGVLAFTLARDVHANYVLRLISLVSCVGFAAWLIADNQELLDVGWQRWSSVALLSGMLAWLMHHMMKTW